MIARDFNLGRLMNSCCIDIDDDVYSELYDYILESGISMDDLNIDDLVVNSLSYYSKEECEEYGIEDFIILKEDEDGTWFLQ